MRFSVFSAAALSAIWVAACSIHPLPENMTRVSTVDIVQQVRCEALTGIDTLASRAEWAFTTEEKKDIYIGFDFTFDMTETNNANSGKLTYLNQHVSGKFTLDLTAGVEKIRQNQRFFRLIQKFEDLSNSAPCAHKVKIANVLYPISGAIGVEEIIHTFGKLRKISAFAEREASKDPTIFPTR